jgi:hypothetical protein
LSEEGKQVESFPLPKDQNIDKLEDFELPNLGIQIDSKLTPSKIISKPIETVIQSKTTIKKAVPIKKVESGRNSNNQSLILANELLSLLVEDDVELVATPVVNTSVAIISEEEDDWNLDEITKFESTIKVKSKSNVRSNFFDSFDDIQDSIIPVAPRQPKKFVSHVIKGSSFKSNDLPTKSSPKPHSTPVHSQSPQKHTIFFPSENYLKSCTVKPLRQVILPDQYKNIQDYRNTYLDALYEQINLEMHEISSKYHSLMKKATKTRLKMMRSMGISYYENIEIYTNSFKKEVTFFIKISEKEKSSYAKDDLWILSSDDTFSEVSLAKSVYHGPTSAGIIQVKLLSGKFKSTNSGYAIRGSNASTELEMIENLNKLDQVNVPILNDLFNKRTLEKQFWLDLDLDRMDEITTNCITKYNLNKDQQNVLFECQKWFNNDKTQSPVVLIHGVFGSGKSYLLVSLILYFVEILTAANEDNIRILISAVTNVAVDRILEGLVEMDFHDFLRIGSQRKIRKRILPYTISTEKSQKELKKEYKEMLKEPMTDIEQKGVKQALDELENGIFEKRKATIKNVKVVGTTCAATVFPVLNDSKFTILILDESSQCIEPLALLPLRFGCERMIACGDPLQLDPTLSGNSIDPKNTLEKTVFLRLSKIGYNPMTLFTQYRCHPSISCLSNKMFYKNQLKDGIDPKDRPAVVRGLPPLVIVDTQGRETHSESSGSNYNEAEVKVVLKLVELLLQEGVDKDDIGVISLFQLQTWKITTELKNRAINLKVSTVDAFQGGEKKIIILSCVKTESLGFIENEKRLNVALSRAKNHLFIVCNQRSLKKGAHFSFVFDHAKKLTNGVKDSVDVLQASSWKEILEAENEQEEFNDVVSQIENEQDAFNDMLDAIESDNDRKRVAIGDINPITKK